MKFFFGKYLLSAAFIFFGVLFFVQNVLAVPCLGVGERCIQLTDAGCGGDEPIGTCGLNGEMTCCKANNLPSPPSSCPTGQSCKAACDLLTEDQNGTCTGGWCCTQKPLSNPPTSSAECTQQGGSCKNTPCDLITETQLGSCGLGLNCCKAITSPSPAGSCTGTGETCRPTGCQTGETSQGPCTGGGVCCKSGTSGGVGGNMVSIEFKNPLAYDTVEGVLDSILDTIRAIIVTLALVFLVVGAVLYITSAGNDGMMKMAKGAITAAMIGLAIGLAAPSFLREISSVLGWTSVNNPDVEKALTLSQIALRVLQFLLSIVGILAIIMLVVGGIIYMTGATTGDEKSKVQTGKNIVKYAIIGIFISLASLVIVSQIADFFM